MTYGYSQFTVYLQEFTNKIKNTHGSINEATNDYIHQAAKYKANLEIREILLHSIADGANKMPTAKELKAIEVKVEKSFRTDKQNYENLYEQQNQGQKEGEIHRPRGLER